jgi:hypothetical protein
MDDAFVSLAWNADLGWWSGPAEVAPGHPPFVSQLGKECILIGLTRRFDQAAWQLDRARP